ncbi:MULTISPECIES: hypothetical protein [unclassified Rhizobium]|nr:MULTISPECIES: hypothetical protein [unclassified Rhizobium]MBB3544491.1 hypothetical protein [Rhizobium sp. BK399]MCS4095862.1 hypothetical protein [Rhizobium sp. BK176]
MQAQSLIAGRDPNPMGSPQFWTEAFIRGGGGGMLGDFVNSSVTRGGEGITLLSTIARVKYRCVTFAFRGLMVTVVAYVLLLVST